MIDRRWLLSPLRVVFLLFGFQFLLWLVFFPDTPTLPGSEPKSHDLAAQMLFFILFLFFCLAIGAGQRLQKRSTSMHRVCPAGYGYFRSVGKLAFWIGSVSMIMQLGILIMQPDLLLLLLSPYGQNQLARIMHQESLPGIPTLSWLLIVPIAIFSHFWFNLPGDKHRRSYLGYAVIALLLLFAYSIFGMARQAFFVGLFVILGAWSMQDEGRLRLKLAPLALVMLTGIITVLGGSAIRMAGLDGAFSSSTYERVWAEFIEEYLPGELNSAFITLSYPTDITKNWLFGTALNGLGPDSFSPSIYINTMNNLAHWYWQFGLLSFVVAAVIGLSVGAAYRNAQMVKFTPNWATYFYLISLPALFTMIRVNAFFLQYFLVPFLFLLAAYIMRALALRLHRPSRKRIQVQGWTSMESRKEGC